MMSEEHDAQRRRLIAALPALSLLSGTTYGAVQHESPDNRSRVLVTYFSRTGNTRVIAGLLKRNLRADMQEILPAIPYPEDYLETVEMAREEHDGNILRSINTNLAQIRIYQTVYLGFPVWGTSVPSVIRTFLSTHDLKNMNIVPFITHGGYGIGDSMEVIKRSAPSALVSAPFVMEADQERRTMEKVKAWLMNETPGT